MTDRELDVLEIGIGVDRGGPGRVAAAKEGTEEERRYGNGIGCAILQVIAIDHQVPILPNFQDAIFAGRIVDLGVHLNRRPCARFEIDHAA